MNIIKGVIDKVASRKLAVTAAAGAAAAYGTIELTWPMAVVAVAYIAGQTVVGYLGYLRGDERQREAGWQ